MVIINISFGSSPRVRKQTTTDALGLELGFMANSKIMNIPAILFQNKATVDKRLNLNYNIDHLYMTHLTFSYDADRCAGRNDRW